MRLIRLISVLALGSSVLFACASATKDAGGPSSAATPATPPGAADETESAAPPAPESSSDLLEQKKTEGGGDKAGGATLPSQPPADDDPTLTKLADAEKALAAADKDLGANVALDSAKGQKKPRGTTPPAKSSAEPLAEGQPRCENACKAFASLRRAAGAVCRLTSEDDGHCKKARELVKTNEARVSACKCNGS